jgi:alpha-tubulin suppressor-like RCC1 family protein
MGFWHVLNKGTDIMAEKGMRSMDPNMLNKAMDGVRILNQDFQNYLNNVPIDELRRCLTANEYMMKCDSANNFKRKKDVEDKIRQLEIAESQKRVKEESSKFIEYLNDTEVNIIISHDVFSNFRNNASGSFNESQKELLKERYGKNIEYILSEKFLEDNEEEFGARNLIWLVKKQKPDAGKGIIALILSKHTFIDLLDKQIELDKKQNEISLVKEYLEKIENGIISSHRMFTNLQEFYDTLPKVYKTEIEKTDIKNKDTILSIDFLKGTQTKTIMEKLHSKSPEIGKEVFELALKQSSYSDKIESNIKNAKNLREETEWTEIKDAFEKLMADIENAIKANSPSDDAGFPKIKEADAKTNEHFLKLKTKIKKLLAEIESLVKKNSPHVRFSYFQMYISAGCNHSVGLKRDGTVVVVGKSALVPTGDTQDWRNIVAVSAGGAYTVGLKKNGTVVTFGIINKDKCNTKDWRDIITVSAGIFHTVGLKKDGTVVAVGDNEKGQCNTQEWRDIIAVSAGAEHTVGLKKDGTVVAVGNNEDGRCNFQSWHDIVAVSAGNLHTIGLKKDGTVVAVGNNEGQCNTQEWRDIIAVSAGGGHTVGLKKDGTVVAVGFDANWQCKTQSWRDIVAVSAGNLHTIGLKKDGTVVAVGNNEDGRCNTQEWRDIGLPLNEAG